MNQEESGNPSWEVAVIERQTPSNYGIASLVLAPLVDDQGGRVYLLIRFLTPRPTLSGVEGDHVYLSLQGARDEAAVQFGVQDNDWKVLPAIERRWIEKGIGH